MTYNVNLLSTTEDCDAVLTWAATEKANAEHNKSNEQWKYNNYMTTATDIETEIASLSSQIATSTNTLAGLTAGTKAYRDENTKLTKLNFALFTQNLRKEKGGSVAVVKTLNLIARLDLEIGELDVLIDAVSTQRSSL